MARTTVAVFRTPGSVHSSSAGLQRLGQRLRERASWLAVLRRVRLNQIGRAFRTRALKCNVGHLRLGYWGFVDHVWMKR